jgi:hypothetical protein
MPGCAPASAALEAVGRAKYIDCGVDHPVERAGRPQQVDMEGVVV